MLTGTLNRYIKIIVLILPLLLFVIYRVSNEKSDYRPISDVNIRVGNDEVQNIPLWYEEEGDVYYAFLPGDANEISLVVPSGQAIVLNGKTYYTGNAPENYEQGVLYDIAVYSKRERLLDSGKVIFLQADTIPTMYITAPNCYDTDQLVKNKEDSLRAIIDLFDAAGNLDQSKECTINGHGNTSWNEQKKPYNLKFDENTSLLGMSEQEKWVLLANSADSSLLRNKIAFTLAQKSGCLYTPESEYVNLYVNGSYQGVYLLAQRVSADGGSVDDESKEQVYLFENDGRYQESEDWFETTNYGIVYSSNEYVFQEAIDRFKDRFIEMEVLIEAEDEEEDIFLASCSEYLDVDSWIRQYMISEFLVNIDLDYASQYFFAYEPEGMIYAGPVWDYDNSMGIFSTMDCSELSPYLQWARGRSGSWLGSLLNHEDFRKEFKAYYENDFAKLITDTIDTNIPMWTEQIDASVYMDSVRWKNGQDTFLQDVAQIQNWLRERKVFYDDYWPNPDSYVWVRFAENGWKDYVYCLKRGTALEQYPQSLLYGETVWKDENGTVIPVGTVIEENTVLYPEYEESQ